MPSQCRVHLLTPSRGYTFLVALPAKTPRRCLRLPWAGAGSRGQNLGVTPRRRASDQTLWRRAALRTYGGSSPARLEPVLQPRQGVIRRRILQERPYGGDRRTAG